MGWIHEGGGGQVIWVTCPHGARYEKALGPARFCSQCRAEKEAARAAEAAKMAAEKDAAWARLPRLDAANAKSVEVFTDYEAGETKRMPVEEFLARHPEARVARGKVYATPDSIGLDYQ